jgi:sodium/potassium-transporting ATPase subunit alpha
LPQVMPTFAELIGVPTALNVAQVLLIDIGTDIWTAIAFAWQPPESKLMAVPPRDPRTERMVTGKVLAYSYGYIGVLQMVVCFFVFFHAVPHMWTMFESYEFKHVSQHAFSDAEENYRGMTAYYWTLVLGQVAAAMATTTTRESLFTYGLPNMMLNICIVFEIVFAVLVIYWKPAENTFKFRALDVTQAAWGMLGFGIIFMFEEVRKKLAAAKERQDKTWR